MIWGVDVHGANGVIDWKALRAGGVDLAIHKATEGETWTDPQFHANWDEMAAAGFAIRGAYALVRSTSQPAGWLKNFQDHVGNRISSDTLPPILDYEGSASGGPPAPIWAAVELFSAAYGRRPMIYGNAGDVLSLLDFNPRFAECPLWIAGYPSPDDGSYPGDAKMPRARNWQPAMWQYSQKFDFQKNGSFLDVSRVLVDPASLIPAQHQGPQQQPLPAVQPGARVFTPPLHMGAECVADLHWPGGGAICLGSDGSIWPWGGAPDLGAPNRDQHGEGWPQGNRRGAQLELIADASGSPTGYRVYDTAGEHYDYLKH